MNAVKKPKVLVLGGGFAGLESTFFLRQKLKDRVDLTLVSDQNYFLYKPNTIYIPFGEDPEQYKIPLKKPTDKRKIEFIQSAVREIDPEGRKVSLESGQVGYDYLIVATGSDMSPGEIPGMEHSTLVWTMEGMIQLRDRLQTVVEKSRAGERQKIVFLIPPNNKCSGPLYELVLMTDTWLREQEAWDNVEITWTTMEESYIQAFGPRLNTVITEEFEERTIFGHKGFVVTHIEPGVVHYQNKERKEFDLLVAAPPYVAKERFHSLPLDDRGFIQVEPDSRRVKGHERVFALGDAGDFPIKQAFLALLQSDAAADHIVAEIEGRKPELNFEPMSMCIMEELNKATFAQVPLKYTGDPEKPVAVDTEDTKRYKVGVSPVWRTGKKILGIYLPWRFGSGKPFHEGFAWDSMDLGLRVMSKFWATKSKS